MQKSLLASLAFATLLASGAAMAQTTTDPTDPGHPRVNEIDQRLENQQNRVNQGLSDKQMTPGQAQHDEKVDNRVEKQLTNDEAKNGGHITKGEQRHMNKELNHNSKRIHEQREGGEKRMEERKERREHMREERKERHEHRGHKEHPPAAAPAQ